MTYEEADANLNYAAKVFLMNPWTKERQDAYDKAWDDFRRAAEAVLGGTACHSVEQAVPETTTNDAQRD